MSADPIIEWVRVVRGCRCAFRVVRRQRFGASFGARAVGPHDDFPEDGPELWAYGSLGRYGFGLGMEGRR